MVLGISNSGGSTRTRESLTLARERGALTVAVVGNRSGPLAGLAERVVHRPVGIPEGLDGARGRVYLNLIEYVATLATLYGVGLELGVRGAGLPPPTHRLGRPARRRHRRDRRGRAAVEPAVRS